MWTREGIDDLPRWYTGQPLVCHKCLRANWFGDQQCRVVDWHEVDDALVLVQIERHGVTTDEAERINEANSSMDFRISDLASRHPPGMVIKTGDNLIWACTVPKGRGYHSQIGKPMDRAKAPRLPDLENFALPEPCITASDQSADPIHPLRSRLADSSPRVLLCRCRVAPLPLVLPEYS